MAESKKKSTRTGHLVKLEVFVPTALGTTTGMIEAAHLIERLKTLRLEEGDYAKIEIISAQNRHCQQFAGRADA